MNLHGDKLLSSIVAFCWNFQDIFSPEMSKFNISYLEVKLVIPLFQHILCTILHGILGRLDNL